MMNERSFIYIKILCVNDLNIRFLNMNLKALPCL